MSYEIKNNEIAFAAAVENINRGYLIQGVKDDTSLKVEPRALMEVHLKNAATGYINGAQFNWTDHVQDDFENGTSVWQTQGGSDTTISTETTTVYEGSNSLKMEWAHDGLTQFNNRIFLAYNDQDIKYRNKLRFQFYPALALEDDLYIKYKNNGSEFTLTTVAAGSVTAGQWNEIEVDLPASDGQKNIFQELIFEFDGLNWTNATHTFYFDYIEFDTHVDITTAPTSPFKRRDLISVGTDGKVVYTAGTPQDTDPVEPPDLPANQVALAIVFVDSDVTTISAGAIFDTRVINKVAEKVLDFDDVSQIVYEHELEIIELQANASVSPFDHDTLISETFSDTTGYNDYVNLGNTDATHNVTTGEYELTPATVESYDFATDPGVDWPLTGSWAWNSPAQRLQIPAFGTIGNAERTFASAQAGGKIVFEFDWLWQEANNPGSTVDVQQISLYNGGTQVAELRIRRTASNVGDLFLNNVDTGITPGAGSMIPYKLTVDLDAGETEVIHNNSDISTQTNLNSASQLTKFSNEHLNNNFINYIDNWVLAVPGDAGSSTVELDLPAITGTVTDFQVVANASLFADDALTYDVEDTNGNIDSGKALNTKNALVNLTSNPVKLRINMSRSTPDSGNILAVKSVCGKTWKA